MINFSPWIALENIQIIYIIKIENMNSKPSSKHNIKYNKSKSQNQPTNNNNPLIIDQSIISRDNWKQQTKQQHNQSSPSVKSNLDGILPPNQEIMTFQKPPGIYLIASGHVYHEKLDEEFYHV